MEIAQCVSAYLGMSAANSQSFAQSDCALGLMMPSKEIPWGQAHGGAYPCTTTPIRARVPQSGTRPRQIQTQLQLFPQPAQPLQYRFCSRRTGSKVPPFTSRSHVHTQRFAFRAPEVHDESVKMSSTTVGRSSALPPALQAARPCAGADAVGPVRSFMLLPFPTKCLCIATR